MRTRDAVACAGNLLLHFQGGHRLLSAPPPRASTSCMSFSHHVGSAPFGPFVPGAGSRRGPSSPFGDDGGVPTACRFAFAARLASLSSIFLNPASIGC